MEGAAGVGQDCGRRGALLLSTGEGDLPSGSVQLLQQAAQVGDTDRHTAGSRTAAGVLGPTTPILWPTGPLRWPQPGPVRAVRRVASMPLSRTLGGRQPA
jgi:hypothetical protein